MTGRFPFPSWPFDPDNYPWISGPPLGGPRMPLSPPSPWGSGSSEPAYPSPASDAFFGSPSLRSPLSFFGIPSPDAERPHDPTPAINSPTEYELYLSMLAPLFARSQLSPSSGPASSQQPLDSNAGFPPTPAVPMLNGVSTRDGGSLPLNPAAREFGSWQFGGATPAPEPNGGYRSTSPLEHLVSSQLWPEAPREGAGSTRASYFLPLSPAPSWDSVLPRRRAAEFSADTGKSADAKQWTDDDRSQSDQEILSDVTPDNRWIPGADYADEHHEFPQAHYRRMPRETRKVFNRATVGELFLRLDGVRHEFDAFHREYNKATGELLESFMKRHGIANKPEQMTPDHARVLLREIAESEDPRIRLYRQLVRQIRMFYRFRTGRGTE